MLQRLYQLWDSIVEAISYVWITYRSRILAFLAAGLYAPENFAAYYYWLRDEDWNASWLRIVVSIQELEDRITSLLSWGFEPTDANKNAFILNLRHILVLLAGIFGALVSIFIFTPGYIVAATFYLLGRIISAIPLVGRYLAGPFYWVWRAIVALFEKIATYIFIYYRYFFTTGIEWVAYIAGIAWFFIARILVPVKQELMEVWHSVNQTWWAQSIAMIVLGEDLYNTLDDFYDALGGDAYVLRQKASSEATWYGIPDPDIILGTGYRARPFSEIGGS